MKLIAPAMAGGGLVWVITIRQRIRQARNAVSKEEFETVSVIVKSSMQQLQEMAAMISDIQKDRIRLETELQKCNAAARHYQQEAQRWKDLAKPPQT